MSETSLNTSPPLGPLDLAWLQSQDAQLDPAKVRYLVAPGAMTKAPWNIHFGDVGIALDASSNQPVTFIVGDGGGLGEGSVSLLAALSPNQPPQLKKVRSALGENVMRYTKGIDGDFRFVIFANTAARVPGKTVTAQTAAELGDWIDRTAKKASDRGSVEEILACSAVTPSISK